MLTQTIDTISHPKTYSSKTPLSIAQEKISLELSDLLGSVDWRIADLYSETKFSASDMMAVLHPDQGRQVGQVYVDYIAFKKKDLLDLFGYAYSNDLRVLAFYGANNGGEVESIVNDLAKKQESKYLIKENGGMTLALVYTSSKNQSFEEKLKEKIKTVFKDKACTLRHFEKDIIKKKNLLEIKINNVLDNFFPAPPFIPLKIKNINVPLFAPNPSENALAQSGFPRITYDLKRNGFSRHNRFSGIREQIYASALILDSSTLNHFGCELNNPLALLYFENKDCASIETIVTSGLGEEIEIFTDELNPSNTFALIYGLKSKDVSEFMDGLIESANPNSDLKLCLEFFQGIIFNGLKGNTIKGNGLKGSVLQITRPVSVKHNYLLGISKK